MQDGLRILNLRELDKEMKRVSVGDAGQGVVYLAVQKRLKTSSSAGKPSVSNPSAMSSPAHVRAKVTSVRSPLRPLTTTAPRKNGTPKKQDTVETGTPTRRVSTRGTFSPLRNPISSRGGRDIGNSTTGVLRTRVSTSRENIFDDASRLLGIRAHPGESISTRLASLRTDKMKDTFWIVCPSRDYKDIIELKCGCEKWRVFVEMHPVNNIDFFVEDEGCCSLEDACQ
ncbi:hypothetical protein DFH29DRAFT_1051415 [Suillus ampliporus]|nr:hypothetical protein DFH29DRAFT_1051415 [Suillus ampliporus]